MAMDPAGRRATVLARVGAEVLLWTAIAAGMFLLGLAALHRSAPEGFMFAMVLVAIIGIYWLRAFLREVLAGRVFTEQNARTLFKIGWLLIAIALAKPLFAITMGVVGGGPLMLLRQPQFLLPMVLALATDSQMVAGVLLLVIASAWRYGSELQQDRDFTV